MSAQDDAQNFATRMRNKTEHLCSIYVMLEQTKQHIERIQKGKDPMCKVFDADAPKGDYGRVCLSLVVPREYVIKANEEKAAQLAAEIEATRKLLAEDVAKFGEAPV